MIARLRGTGKGARGRQAGRTDAELLACVLYWGIDRRVPASRVGTLLAGLPDWLQRQHELRGSDDPMIQSLILDHLRARAGT